MIQTENESATVRRQLYNYQLPKALNNNVLKKYVCCVPTYREVPVDVVQKCEGHSHFSSWVFDDFLYLVGDILIQQV